ncbi:phosphodiesterase [Jeotgalibacillus proteolyticus]|uniref:Phosphodiesterase n=1 Tax=Jeotgalibacillus proteolyticus TaxID=2082395 RepID=A0A2S5G6Y1_9BACL|nr:phosphodiesterase [Jeotgalibacillus proteolyticus]
MVRKILLSVVIFISMIVLICWYFLLTPAKDLDNILINKTDKPVILFVIDSLMDEPLQKTINEGKAPALKFLLEHGQYHSDVVSSYPTMSVTIDSTLLTGTYADKHKIPGLSWFKKDENRLVIYGGGFSEIWNAGFSEVAHNSLIQLNHSHLNPFTPTIYEELTKSDIQSASINGLVYRGEHIHSLTIPKLISGVNVLSSNVEINGPDVLSLGSLSQINPKNDRFANAWQGLGMNDQFTTNEVNYLLQQDKLPAFTLAYFPNLDRPVHKHGVKERKEIEEVDKQIQTILNTYSSWDDAIDKAIWIVHGDSGQSDVIDNRDEALIDLNSLLNEYTFWDFDNPASKELALAVNERMAYIYIQAETIEAADIISELKKESRIGFIAWKVNKIAHVMSTDSDEILTFSPHGSYKDKYKQSWSINGNPAVLDLTVNNQNEIMYDEYPDALSRLYGALYSHNDQFIIVDAKPGYEFIGTHSPNHVGGGAHGSLHKLDSLVPLIIAGTEKTPENNRLVDFKKWLIELTK